MLTKERIYNTAVLRYRLGTGLIWLGVLAWLPFIVLQIAGAKPSLLWFLPFHLIGVVGGARLRSSAREEMETPPAKKDLFHIFGYGLIYAGILVWAPYFYLKIITDQGVEVMSFLPYHLAGVLGGLLLLVVRYLNDRKNKVAA